MTFLRHLLFLLVILSVFLLNYLLVINKISPLLYIVIITTTVIVFIIAELLYSSNIQNKLQNIKREKEKLELSMMDIKNETILLTTLTDILETFGEEIALEDVLEKIAGAVKNIFQNETVVIHLMGEIFKKCVMGNPIEIPDEMLSSIILKSRPLLINNTSSFPECKGLAKQGVHSFIISTFHHKRIATGIIGIFSFDNRPFTMKELELIRMVSAPTSLLVENAELFERTKLFSITDALTNIHNRRHFEDVFEQTIQKTKNKAKPLSVCMADIDYFKHYNDINGHPAGDYALQKIAEIIMLSIKGSDIVARYGGEEFVIVFPDTTKENTCALCENIRQKIQEFRFGNEENQPNGDLTISMGISSYPSDGETGVELIKKADIALYKAKAMGRNKVVSA